MTPFVSIIVPIYDSGRYLEKCLSSIAEQTFKDYELILVDDGSSDNSYEICCCHAAEDDRIHIIRKDNGGVSSARNAGLGKAKGQWIYFCDPDDYLNSDTLGTLVEGIGNRVDLILAGYSKTGLECVEANIIPDSGMFDRDIALEKYFESGGNKVQGFIWNRLFRKEIIDAWNLRFNEDIHYKEDGLFIIQYMCRMRNGIHSIATPVYNYVIHPDSAMGIAATTVTPKFLTNLDARILTLQEIRKWKCNSITVSKAEEAVFNFELWVFAIMKENGNIDFSTLFGIIGKTIKAIGPMTYFKLIFKRLIHKL